MNPFWCPHTETTDTDGTGRAICLRCGSSLRVTLTRDMFMLACDQMLYGVSYEDAWGNRIDPRDVHAGPRD